MAAPGTVSGSTLTIGYTDSQPGVTVVTGTPAAPAAVPAGAISVGSVKAAPGGQVTIAGGGFNPGTTVVITIYSAPVRGGGGHRNRLRSRRWHG